MNRSTKIEYRASAPRFGDDPPPNWPAPLIAGAGILGLTALSAGVAALAIAALPFAIFVVCLFRPARVGYRGFRRWP